MSRCSRDLILIYKIALLFFFGWNFFQGLELREQKNLTGNKLGTNLIKIKKGLQRKR